MLTRSLSTLAGAMVLALASIQPAMAQEATPWPELMMKMADTNKDGMLTRQEFLDHMGKMWDKKHAAMMKSDSSMKSGMMTMTQFKTFAPSLIDPLQIGG